MQPYFFPYLGHFALIASVDRWIVFDVTQYTPRTWMNRNRILHPSGGSQYITVALANSSISIKTHQALISDVAVTRRAILGKLTLYRRAPFYARVKDLVAEVFDNFASNSLVALNISALKAVCRYLDLKFDFEICSQMKLDIPERLGPGEWAPAICAAIGATEYLNPIRGGHLFNVEEFKSRNIDLKFLNFETFEYPTGPYAYVPNLSVLDVLMWNAPQCVVKALNEKSTIVRSCGGNLFA